MAYDAKNSQVRGRQLKVQKLSIPLFIGADAVPADKVVTVDESFLFLNVEGIQGITLASGAVDSQDELDAITFATADDGTGVFNALVRISEPLDKVCSAKLVSRAGASDVCASTFPTGATAGITLVGDKVVLNFDCGRDFSAADGDYCLEVEYIVSQ